uniref:Uncharacterized protein n=1 Tax=Rhipicephalus pulchellus TaxID=72859 RepID=L7LUK9_RHIPC
MLFSLSTPVFFFSISSFLSFLSLFILVLFSSFLSSSPSLLSPPPCYTIPYKPMLCSASVRACSRETHSQQFPQHPTSLGWSLS